jgi:hypothetical protein
MITLQKEAMLCYVLADLAFFLGVAIYVLNRIGILRFMSPRHALICWQLVCGSSLLARSQYLVLHRLVFSGSISRTKQCE